jgi:hypothetical protein
MKKSEEGKNIDRPFDRKPKKQKKKNGDGAQSPG